MMSLLDVLNTTTGGVRSGLTLLGLLAGSVLFLSKKAEEREELYRHRTTSLFALACVMFSPAHAAYLLGSPVPLVLARFLDLVATSLSCAALIYLLASRAIQRGVPMFRVRRAMAANVAVIAGFVLVAWATAR